MITNNTKIHAVNLADRYLARLKNGEFKSYIEMHNAILYNVVNSKYNHNSNYFVDCLWERIHSQT